MIYAGIIGGAGYTAGELLRLLVFHPEVRVAFVHSESHAGVPVSEVHAGLVGDTDLVFCSEFDLRVIDVLFLCSGHGRSREFLQANEIPDNLVIIDLAQDFRDESEGFVYGLPELQRERIRGAKRIANPGCFATAIQLALLPLAAAGRLAGAVSVTAVTGSTGAGVKPTDKTHFSWRTDNLSAYKVFTHQHLEEISRNLSALQGSPVMPAFVPVRGDFARGIFADATLRCALPPEDVLGLYEDYYRDAVFTHVIRRPADLKQVVNTNKCILSLEQAGDHLAVVSVLDNLLKGASGQAVQNMNLAFRLAEDRGLRLKASAF